MKRQADRAVLLHLRLRAEDLAFLGAEVRRLVPIELEAGPEAGKLHLVQPAGVHLDVEPQQDAQGCVAFDIDGGSRALDHRTSPRLRW